MQLSRKKKESVEIVPPTKNETNQKKLFYLDMHNNNKTLIKKYFFSPLCCTSIFQLVIGLPARWIKSNQNAIKIIKFRMQKKNKIPNMQLHTNWSHPNWSNDISCALTVLYSSTFPNSTFGSVKNYNFVYVSNETDSRSSCSPSWSTRY